MPPKRDGRRRAAAAPRPPASAQSGPTAQAAPFDRARFRQWCRRTVGITEATEARFNRADKPVGVFDSNGALAAALSKNAERVARMQDAGTETPFPVYAFGPVISDDLAWWYLEGEDDFLTAITPGTIQRQLAAIPEGANIELLVNSPGGEVAAATAAGNMLDDRIKGGSSVHARIVGDALSAASALMLRSTSSEIDPMGLVMIHNPWTFAFGDADSLEEQAAVLRKIEANAAAFYAQRVGTFTEESARAAMAAETWYSAAEAVEQGLVGKVSESPTYTQEEASDDDLAAAAREDLTVLCAGVNARRAALFDSAGAVIAPGAKEVRA